MLHKNTVCIAVLVMSLSHTLHISAQDYFSQRTNQINITGTLNSRYASQVEMSYQHRILHYMDAGIGAEFSNLDIYSFR